MMVKGINGFNVERQAMADDTATKNAAADGRNSRPLTDAARRALAEAEERRKEYRQREAAMPKEIGGRGGKEPGRYGDWEVKGIASDF
jgi:hypothetical protein